MGKRFVIGDIHGRISALKQCLERCKFNYDEDKLILLGDLVDGGCSSYLVIEELLKIKNIVFVLGNHCFWFLKNMNSGWKGQEWVQQGGANTLKSYGGVIYKDTWGEIIYVETDNINVPVTHQDFFNRGKYYHIEDNMLFVHGGIDPEKSIDKQDREKLLWDRMLIDIAREEEINYQLKHETAEIPIKFGGFDYIFVGHTSTWAYSRIPIKYCNVWCLDQGAGWLGKLSIMDIDSKEYWQSDVQVPPI